MAPSCSGKDPAQEFMLLCGARDGSHGFVHSRQEFYSQATSSVIFIFMKGRIQDLFCILQNHNGRPQKQLLCQLGESESPLGYEVGYS